MLSRLKGNCNCNWSRKNYQHVSHTEASPMINLCWVGMPTHWLKFIWPLLNWLNFDQCMVSFSSPYNLAFPGFRGQLATWCPWALQYSQRLRIPEWSLSSEQQLVAPICRGSSVLVAALPGSPREWFRGKGEGGTVAINVESLSCGRQLLFMARSWPSLRWQEQGNELLRPLYWTIILSEKPSLKWQWKTQSFHLQIWWPKPDFRGILFSQMFTLANSPEVCFRVIPGLVHHKTGPEHLRRH